MGYIIALICLIIVYIIVVYLMKYMNNIKLYNVIFASIITVSYIVFLSIIYVNAGPNDWNFHNALPCANVSPFMFCITPIVLLLPKKIRKYLMLLISLLVVGMFLSTVINCVYNAVINYKFHFHFLLDYINHFALSLWGVYIVKSRQVALTKRNSLISGSLLLGVATIMLIINLIFDTAFFGLSLYGKHNIYNVVLTSSSLLSAFLYYVGVVGVLFIGFITQQLINKPRRIKQAKGN